MGRKNVQTMFDSISEIIQLRQSENRKNNRKTFEGASVDLTICSFILQSALSSTSNLEKLSQNKNKLTSTLVISDPYF